ncbi:hypothetical protein L3X38_009364 [Prunus dulcis]|uniref:Uncharacterized protein n=1 Tax=Prunus dulcis TaxID=3755 RepID=A0AAD4ZY77_PRUDU|nr:hypothetical protein L3X38_009364 [Prunus dulcis]
MLGWRTMPLPGPRSTPYTFSWRGVVEKDNFGTKQQPAIPPTASSQLFRLRWSNSIKLLSSAPLETAVAYYINYLSKCDEAAVCCAVQLST